ncbi:MAG TPA: LysE family transporter [Bacillota bacterium]|nr:LysE family transporter [Bacillota bacterium]
MLNIGAFISYALITTFTPGPNNIMSMTNASRHGFSRSIRFNYGVFCGFVVIILLCTLFSAGLYRFIPAIKPVMTLVGAAYILQLAWKILRSQPKDSEAAEAMNTFKAGLLLQFVNPKVILYGITTVSTFILPYYSSPALLAGFAVLLAFLGFVGTCSWALFGAVFQRFLASHHQVVNTVMSVLLVYCAVSLFL